ncbi:MAG TPA: hypothetical protein VK589_27175 [Chryseolinea sp.]|nr:hypothetical protein [Chryseolinea sp.]
MKTCRKPIFLIVLAVLFGCDPSSDTNGIMVFSYSFDFGASQDNWEVDFTDFPAGVDSSSYELKFAYTDRPSNLGNQKSLMMSGNNQSDDLFMFMKRKITDLTPNTDYTLVFEVELASNAPKGLAGIGGAPGESVFLKAGAASTEPKRVIEGNQYALNVNKGNQSDPGEMTTVLGDIAVSYDTQEYALINRNSAGNTPFIARSNSNGEIWLVIGTDSGFEGTTTVYYTRINVVFSATN